MAKFNPLEDYVQGQTIDYLDEFTLESGKKLLKVPVAYKTWGSLNPEGTNCMVICHALSGSCDVQDWWGPLLGPGKTFDTNRFFIFCGNVLGSPYGTASPCTMDPSTGKAYGPNFPLTTIRDDVNLHKKILDRLGVKSVEFCVGGSMGGMQVLEWAFFGKDYVKNICPIATSGRHSAWCISWGETQRQSIYSDPKYAEGLYEMSDPPISGLSAARMAAMLTYRSRNSFESRFGRKLANKKSLSDLGAIDSKEKLYHNEGNKIRLHNNTVNPSEKAEEEFSVYSAQSYLRYKGDQFNKRFDANCYISITRKLDTHDISRGRGDYSEVLKQIEQPCFVVGIASDGLFTVEEQHELGEGIPNATVEIIDSGEGHDGFLLEFVKMRDLLESFINSHATSKPSPDAKSSEPMEVKASVFGEAEGDLLQCLPYCDQGLDLDAAEALVQREVQRHMNEEEISELKLFEDRPGLKELLENVEKKIKINAINTCRFRLEAPKDPKGDWKGAVLNARAQLEYQLNREVNLELLSKYGNNAWIINNYILEQQTAEMQKEIDQIDAKLLEINMHRKQEQEFAGKKLTALKQKQQELINQIVQLRMINSKMEHELNN